MKERFLIISLVLGSVLLLVFTGFGNQGRYYDCRDAHWHPDYPVEVKQECAKLLYEHWKKQQNERKDDKDLHEGRPNIFRT
jgi:hypothetical protein